MIMSILRRVSCRAALLMVAAVQVAGAAEPPPGPALEGAVDPALRRIASLHAGSFGGKRLRYEAVVEEIIVPDRQGRPAASLVSFSYLQRQPRPAPARPVLFVFNGGPGSASIWTHFGMLGPRQVRFADPVRPPTAPPFEIGDNPHSLLDVADLVFIDPALTGYSRLLPGARAEDFLGVTEDARATADFMRQWLTRHGRWNAPRFLVGES